MSPLGRSIVFFGDGSQETKTPLARILHSRRDDTLLAKFFRQASAALVDEVRKLPSVDQAGFPDFRDLNNIDVAAYGGTSHPALQPVEIVLVQLGHFIE